MILGLAGNVLVLSLIFQRVEQFEFARLIDDSLRQSEGPRWSVSQFLCHLVYCLVKVCGWYCLVDQSECFRFLSADCSSSHDEFEGSSGTKCPGEEVATSRIWYQAYSDEGLFEACLV